MDSLKNLKDVLRLTKALDEPCQDEGYRYLAVFLWGFINNKDQENVIESLSNYLKVKELD